MPETLTATSIDVRAVFEAHVDYVWRTLRRLGASPSDVEDLAQEVFLVVHQKLATYDASRPIRPWLFGIARNVLRDHASLARHRREVLDEGDEVAKSDPNIRFFESAELVYAALSDLEEPLRAILVLRDMDELGLREAAELLSVPVDTAYGRLKRAREAFRLAVRRRRGGHADA